MWCRKIKMPVPRDLGWSHTAVLAPADAMSEDTLSKLPEGVTLRVEASQPRNAAYHRFYWALVGKIHQNLPEGVILDRESLHDVIKMGAGCKRVIKIPPDTFYELPGSIAFHKMDEQAFREFMDRAIQFIVTILVPQMDREVLENEVWDFLSGSRA